MDIKEHYVLIGLERLEKRNIYYIDMTHIPRFLRQKFAEFMIERYKNGRR